MSTQYRIKKEWKSWAVDGANMYNSGWVYTPQKYTKSWWRDLYYYKDMTGDCRSQDTALEVIEEDKRSTFGQPTTYIDVE